MEEKAKMDNRSRMKEIREVLFRNHITRGVTPEKLRVILEELGPTYIKLGQIMSLHSDILPKAYCDELVKLNYDVTPMPFSEVEEVINRSYREDWHQYFKTIDQEPLGSASIAQVHRAVLLTGEEVVVKVQRKGIYDMMARDIGLLHRIVRLMPSVGGLKNVVDLGMILDEMWAVAQEEMDFLKEAANIEEFTRNNTGIAYVRVPHLYREYTTSRVLVMEYVGGCAINDRDHLLGRGYDLEEVGRKFINNYIKQVMEDGFFHADPHPGNVKVHDGKIVWIDMGMMGRLSNRDKALMERAI
ncbi:MAG: AarF/ABC1/UbiB kinase family protein, partial [Lachnospiraceae bacterium]|nr:AarF/ABC1/UbiB kinase family protein [Lachnospiraceae bacterium]